MGRGESSGERRRAPEAGRVEARAGSRIELSEERLRLIQAAGGIGGFDWDIAAGQASGSPELYALLGLPQTATLDRETWKIGCTSTIARA